MIFPKSLDLQRTLGTTYIALVFHSLILFYKYSEPFYVKIKNDGLSCYI